MAIKRDVIVQNAEKLVAKGKIEAAIKEYLKLVEDNPNDTNILNRVGDLYVRINRIKEATKYFYDIARFWADDGFYLKSIAILKKINKLDPSLLEVYEKLGELYSKQGMNSEAASHYQYLADYYNRQGQAAQSLEIYRKIVAMDPDNIAMRGKLAELLNQNGHTQEAVSEFQSIGKMLVGKGHIQEAIQVYQRALKLDPRNIAMVKELAESLLNEGRAVDVVKLLESTNAAQSADPDVFILLAQAYQLSSAVQNALEAIAMGLRKSPDHPRLHELKGEVLQGMGRGDDAILAFQQAASVAYAAGDPQRALSICFRILKKDPVNISTLQKVVQFNESMKQETHLAQTLSMLVDAYTHFKMFNEAGATLERLIQLDPENHQHREKLAFIKQKMGKRVTLQDISRPEVGQEEIEELPEIDIPMPEPTEPSASTATVRPAPLEAEAIIVEDDLPPDLKDYVGEHMVEIDVFTKYNLTDKAIQGLQVILERVPHYIPSLEKLLQIFLEENRTEEAEKVGRKLMELYASRGLDDREENLKEQLLMQGIAIDEGAAAQAPAAAPGTDTLVSVDAVPAESRFTEETVPGLSAPAADEAELELDLGSADAIELDMEMEDDKAAPELSSTSSPSLQAEPESAPLVDFVEPVPELQLDETIPESEPEPEPRSVPEPDLIPAPELALPLEPELLSVPEPEPLPPPPPPSPRPSVRVAPPSEPGPALRPSVKVQLPPAPPEKKPPAPSKSKSSTGGLDLDGLLGTKKPTAPPKPKPAAPDLNLDLLLGTKKPAAAPPKPKEKPPTALLTELDHLAHAPQEKAKPKPQPAPPQPAPSSPPPPAPPKEATGLGDFLSMSDEIGDFLQQAIPVEHEPPVEVLGELDFYMEQEIADEAEKLLKDLKNRFPDHPEVVSREKRFQALIKKAPVAAAPAPEIADGESLFSDEEEFFDLASELEEDMAEEKKEVALPAQAEPTLEEVFEQFKQGVQQTLSPEDYDTHYNLGIAYKEMGLVDEAISEFQIACKDSGRLIDCCSMLGMCFLEKGMPQLAEKWYRKAMESPDLSEDEQLGILYDLGNLYQQIGDLDNAHKSFMEIYGARTSYRDVMDRLKELDQARQGH